MNKKQTHILQLAEFLDRPGFRYSEQGEGVTNFVFGCRAGPDYSAFNLAHEVAHVLELTGNERRFRFKNGTLCFKLPPRVRIGMWSGRTEPNTDQMSRRELRTFAIQYLIMKECSITSKQRFLSEIFELFSWLPDNLNFHRGAFKNSPEFKKFLALEFEKELEKISIQKVMKKWNSLKFV